LEDNKQKDFDDVSMFHENFKDFDEEENTPPEIDEDLAEADSKIDDFEKKEVKENVQVPTEEQKQEMSPWEELDENNAIVKKYIFQISKDYVSYIDALPIEERNTFVNSAIKMKIDLEDEKKQESLKKKIKMHFILMCIAMCIFAPITLFIAHKAIMITFDNYKYSQENFEKLYRERFLKDRAYMRSIQYNKEQEMKKKKQ
jgi:hypothetical protein